MGHLSNVIFPPSSNNSVLVSKPQTLAGTGTVITPIFTLTGTVEVVRMWGVVTTDISANHTASAYRLNDQGAQVDITLNTGAVLSTFKAGSTIARRGLAATAVSTQTNSSARVSEAASAGQPYFSPIFLVKKTAALTQIEYVFATTDNPCSGVIQHFVEYRPLSADGMLVAT